LNFPKTIGALLAVVFVVLVSGVIAVRFADAPLGPLAGGPFTSGEMQTGPEPDWSFVRELPTVEFQLLNPARSRTTWILERERRIYIPSGYMNTRWGRLWKQWPIEAELDGRAILRVGGRRYPRKMIRIQSAPLIEPLVEELAAKYKVPATAEAVQSGSLWLFELARP